MYSETRCVLEAKYPENLKNEEVHEKMMLSPAVSVFYCVQANCFLSK